MDQIDLIDIYGIFHPEIINFTFFSSAHGTFSRTDHILGHKSSLGKFKKIEIISSVFSDHNAVRLDVNYRRKSPSFHAVCWDNCLWGGVSEESGGHGKWCSLQCSV